MLEKITGPYKGCPHNPILTHRHLGADYPITCTGHADLVQTQTGDWWMVLLACRPIKGLSLLGRETFLTPVDWPEEDWPVVNPGKGIVELSGKSPSLSPPSATEAAAVRDEFLAEGLPLHWCHLLNPAERFWATGPEGLRLHPSRIFPEENGSPALLARRVGHHQFTAQAEMVMPSAADGLEAGILLFQNHANHLRVSVVSEEGTERFQILQMRKGEREILAQAVLPPRDEPSRIVRFQIRGVGLGATLTAWADGQNLLETEPLDAGFLAAALAGGFTGVMTGFFAWRTETSPEEEPVFVRFFEYQAE